MPCSRRQKAKAKDEKAKDEKAKDATYALGALFLCNAKAKVAQRITQGTLAWVGRLLLCRQRKSAPKAQGQKASNLCLPLLLTVPVLSFYLAPLLVTTAPLLVTTVCSCRRQAGLYIAQPAAGSTVKPKRQKTQRQKTQPLLVALQRQERQKASNLCPLRITQGRQKGRTFSLPSAARLGLAGCSQKQRQGECPEVAQPRAVAQQARALRISKGGKRSKKTKKQKKQKKQKQKKTKNKKKTKTKNKKKKNKKQKRLPP
jgi:hypothetical protein